jgi:hypothetical protein
LMWCGILIHRKWCVQQFFCCCVCSLLHWCFFFAVAYQQRGHTDINTDWWDGKALWSMLLKIVIVETVFIPISILAVFQILILYWESHLCTSIVLMCSCYIVCIVYIPHKLVTEMFTLSFVVSLSICAARCQIVFGLCLTRKLTHTAQCNIQVLSVLE